MSTIISIPLSAVDISSPDHDRYIVTYPREWVGVRESLNLTGRILSPPVVIPGTARNMYQIICGYKRIRAIMELGWDHIHVNLFEPEHFTRTDLIKISVMDNMQGRGLNPVEKSNALNRFFDMNANPAPHMLEEFCNILEISGTEDSINRYRSLDQLGDRVKRAICDGSMNMQQGLMLLELPDSERDTVAVFLESLTCNTNEMRNFIEGVRELAARRNCSVNDIIQDETITEILRSEDLHARQKTARVLDRIHALRYPQRSLWETKFKEELKKLHLPQSVHIIPSQFFEGNWLELKARFTDSRQVDDFTDLLSQTATREIIKNLFKFTNGSYRIKS